MSVKFSDACRNNHGSQLASCDGYEMPSDADAIKAAADLGCSLVIPLELQGRRCVLRRQHHKLIASIPHLQDDPNRLRYWVHLKTKWESVLGTVEPDQTIVELDKWLRCIETSGRLSGWGYRKEDGDWVVFARTSDAKLVAQFMLKKPKNDVECDMGRCETDPWKFVSIPFAPVELSGRRWNLNAPQWRHEPVAGPHPHWDIVLNHIGQTLDPYLPALDWAKAVGIRTGGDYLRTIFASILREPLEPTPYLFLFGPENSGKSSLHEAFDLLVTRGVVKADRALTSQSDFNGELASAVLAVVEEKDISKSPGSLAKIKDAVTSRRLSIRKMYCEPFEIDNHCHWIQCANNQLACPKFPGDTRIQPIFVPLPQSDIPKPVLMERLKEEAPAFLYTIKTLALPPMMGRLRIPLVETAHSRKLESDNTDPLILALAEFVKVRKTWRGTAKQLHGEIESPKDYRPLWKYLTSNEALLLRHGVRFSEVPQSEDHKGTRQLVLSVMADK